MKIFLRKYFVAVHLVTITLCAVLAAKATNHWLEAKLLLTLPVPPARGAPGRPSEAARGAARGSTTTQPKEVQPVVERNIFCSSCAPPVKVVAAGAVGEAVGEATCGTVGPFALLATLYSEDDAWSVAAVQDITTNVSGVVRIGSIAPGSSKITSIEPKRVRYVTSGTPGCIEMVDGAKAVAAPAPTIAEAGVAVPSADDGFPAGDLDRGIKKVSDTQFDLQRGLVDKILGDTATLARQARIVPAVKDGKANGFRLYAIRPGSVFARIGLENGDTIHVINGQEISTPDRALEVYTKLRSASHLTISITRRGEPKTIDYSIR